MRTTAAATAAAMAVATMAVAGMVVATTAVASAAVGTAVTSDDEGNHNNQLKAVAATVTAMDGDGDNEYTTIN